MKKTIQTPTEPVWSKKLTSGRLEVSSVLEPGPGRPERLFSVVVKDSKGFRRKLCHINERLDVMFSSKLCCTIDDTHDMMEALEELKDWVTTRTVMNS